MASTIRPDTNEVVRHPCVVRLQTTSGTIRPPTPMPVMPMPIAVARRRRNQLVIVVAIGKKVPRPEPTAIIANDA